jgi:hypothetical protein
MDIQDGHLSDDTADTLAGLLLVHAERPPAEEGISAWQLAHSMHVVSWQQPEALRSPVAVRALLKLILATNLSVRGEALGALWNLTADEEGTEVVVAMDGIPELGHALIAADSEREACIGGMSAGLTLRQAAAAATRNISASADAAHCGALLEAGVVTPLLSLIHEEDVPLEAQHDALLVLWQLSGVDHLLPQLLDLKITHALPELLEGIMKHQRAANMVTGMEG